MCTLTVRVKKKMGSSGSASLHGADYAGSKNQEGRLDLILSFGKSLNSLEFKH